MGDSKNEKLKNKIHERLEELKSAREQLAAEVRDLEREGKDLRGSILKTVDKTKRAKIMKFIAKQN